MKKYIPIVAIFLLVSPLRAEIYKWTDNNGNVHFSDKFHAGAKTVTIHPTQTYSPQQDQETNIQTTEETKGDASTPYTKIIIIQPQDQATLRNNQKIVTVGAAIEPELKKDDALQLLFDGEPSGPPHTSLKFTLSNVNRGSHIIFLQIIDKSGAIIGSSQPIKFYMHQTIAGGGN